MNSEIPDLVNINKSALKFLFGEKLVCRLCISCIQSDIESVTLEDSVTLERYFFVGTLTFNQIFQELNISQEHSLPGVICMDCALRAIDTFLFHVFCHYSNTQWADILAKLEKNIPQTKELHFKTNNVYISNDPDIGWVSSCKPLQKKTCENAAIQLRKSILIRNKNLRRRHSGRKCKQCHETFDNLSLLKEHYQNNHNNIEQNIFVCPECNREFRKKLYLRTHFERVHMRKTIPCTKCDKKLGSKRILNIHFKHHHIPVECTTCKVELPNRAELNKHTEMHANLTCPNCSKVFMTRPGYREHMIHNKCGEQKPKSIYCDICNRVFGDKRRIRDHMKLAHGFGKVYKCGDCDKKYCAMSSLIDHQVKHTRERKFACEQCGGLFVTKHALIYHMRIHTGERPFPCEICGERFLSASRRMAHKNSKHFGPNKLCDLCPSKFTTNFQLRKHKDRHYNPQSKLYLPNLAPKAS